MSNLLIPEAEDFARLATGGQPWRVIGPWGARSDAIESLAGGTVAGGAATADIVSEIIPPGQIVVVAAIQPIILDPVGFDFLFFAVGDLTALVVPYDLMPGFKGSDLAPWVACPVVIQGGRTAIVRARNYSGTETTPDLYPEATTVRCRAALKGYILGQGQPVRASVKPGPALSFPLDAEGKPATVAPPFGVI